MIATIVMNLDVNIKEQTNNNIKQYKNKNLFS